MALKTKALVFSAFFLLFSGRVYSVSFSCEAKLNTVELQICKFSELGSLDDELSSLYKNKLREVKYKNSLMKSQTHWLEKIRNSCRDKDCIKHAYENRNNALRNWLDEESSLPSSQLSLEIPNSYFGKYRAAACDIDMIEEKGEWKCNAPSWSNIDIARRNNESAFFTVNTRNPGGHGCTLSGIARIDGEFLIGSGKANFGEGVCTLKFKLDSESVTIEQQGEKCGTMPLCGYGDTFNEGKIYKKY